MKIKNLFCSILMVCLAALVFCGASVPALQFHAQAMTVRTASNGNGNLSGKLLFDADGNYTVTQDDLAKAVKSGEVFQFFGYDWRVVFVNKDQKVATFWMTDPYTTSVFNMTSSAQNGVATNGSNIWANGYTNTIWKSSTGDVSIGQSKIKSFLTTEAENILNNGAYDKYKNKIVKGAVIGTNEEATQMTVEKLSYSVDNINDVTQKNEVTNELVAEYGLGTDAILWLPSADELVNKWKLHENVLQWTDNTNNNGRAWLRSPDYEDSEYAMCICSKADEAADKIDDYFALKAIKQEAGVRPAIHLNIGEICPESDGNAWFNGDWIKILFIVVCVLGIVGVALVTTAVIIKSRQAK